MMLLEMDCGNGEHGAWSEWDEHGANVLAGPNKRFYKSGRKECGAHMTYNAFWEVPNFCVQQMLPRDGMHAIDLGGIVRLILVMLRKFCVYVEQILNVEGLAAEKLKERMGKCWLGMKVLMVSGESI